MDQALIVWTTVPDSESATSLAQMLVERRLAACVNMTPAMQTIYRWQGRIEHAVEVSLMIKTSATRYSELEAAIIEAHPYDVPEIIALPIDLGFPPYLNWIVAETKKELNA